MTRASSRQEFIAASGPTHPEMRNLALGQFVRRPDPVRAKSRDAAPARRTRRAMPSLGVDWHLPARTGAGFAKRRFASTTVASSFLIETLAADGLTWSGLVEAIRFDDEAKAVATAFVEAGHGDALAAPMLAMSTGGTR